jgi:3alpha(or 20beta)-hydroxysteroid dehydrogenase
MTRFADQTVLISGGARGMGASHARGFAAEGANVVIGDVLEDEGGDLAARLGAQASFVQLDVTSEDDWGAAVDAAEHAFGPVSVLVNNAGIMDFGLIEETEPAAWRRLIDVNLTGEFLGIRAVTPSMRRAGGGAIVNVSSVGGFAAGAGLGAYVASKWAIRGLTRTAALELGRDDIRVNSVHPGLVRTPMASTDGVADLPVQANAIPRLAEPEEITALVLFIASRDAAFSTGSEFTADGGRLAGDALLREAASTTASA